jgi:hypothetical protein
LPSSLQSFGLFPRLLFRQLIQSILASIASCPAPSVTPFECYFVIPKVGWAVRLAVGVSLPSFWARPSHPKSPGCPWFADPPTHPIPIHKRQTAAANGTVERSRAEVPGS